MAPIAGLRRTARKRTKPNFSEQALGIAGKGTSFAQDFFSNVLARTGFGTSSLENGSDYAIQRWTLNWWAVLSVFETSWVARRIVIAPAEDIIKTWPDVHSDTDPKQLAKIDKVIRKTNTKNQLLEGLIWGRLFGGAGALIVIKGDENRLDEPLDLDRIELKSYKGLSIFDRWGGITPGTDICEDIDRPLDFGLPEYYDCGGKGSASQRVHSSRILRFTGPIMPEPERSAYSGWGLSVLAPVIQTITSYDNVSSNALSLSFRAQLIGMTIPDLEQMLSGLGATQGKSTSAAQKFASRMQQINEMISNQSMVLLPKDGALTATNYSFSGMYELMQAFQLQVAGAAKMPVSLLWGRTLNGLGQAGDGDERMYEKTVATEGNSTLRPALEKLYPVIATSELGEVPEDMELDFPSIRVLTEQEKAELAKSSVDAITVCINTGIMSPRTGAKEVKQQSTVTGFGTNLTDEEIDKLSEDVQAEGELGEGLFGEEGGKTLDPSGSPTAALKETDKLTGQKKPQNAPGKTVGAPKVPLDEDPDDVKPVPTAAEKAKAAPPKKEAPVKAKAADEDGPGPERQVHGMTCVIETPKNYERHGKDEKGERWRQRMTADYGYLVGHRGADGDSLDCYIGPEPTADWTYVVDQAVLGDRSKYDEAKVMLGFSSQGDALRAYKANHHRSADVYLDFTPMHINDFKEWLLSRDPKKPCSPDVKVRAQ